tara:strand:+ start:503 stop:775 length:273 start_codon:yes stop_codon:yes gene_type:complete
MSICVNFGAQPQIEQAPPPGSRIIPLTEPATFRVKRTKLKSLGGQSKPRRSRKSALIRLNVASGKKGDPCTAYRPKGWRPQCPPPKDDTT